MKQIILSAAVIICSFAAMSASAQQAAKLHTGDGIPGAQIKLQSVSGKEISLSQEIGQNGLLVMFSCNTCPFVVRNQSVTEKVMKYAMAHHVGMVIINSNENQRDGADSYEAMKKYAATQGYAVPYVVDHGSELADMFGANHTPEIYLFNKEGKLTYQGAMNDNPSDLAGAKRMYITEAIDAQAAGKSMNPDATKSVGCSIKRKA